MLEMNGWFIATLSQAASEIFRCEPLSNFFTLVAAALKASSLMHYPMYYFNLPEENRLEIQLSIATSHFVAP